MVVVIVSAAVRVVVEQLIYSSPTTITFTTISTVLTATTIFYRRIVCGGCGVKLVICVCIDVVVGMVVVVVVGYCDVKGCYFIALGVL